MAEQQYQQQNKDPNSVLFDSDEYIEGLSEEARKTRDTSITVRNANNVTANKMQQQYGVGIEFTIPRMDFMFKWMMRNGILTDEQYWQMMLDWELEFQAQLDAGMQQIESQMRQQAIRQGRPDPTKKPPPNGLIVPGH